MAQFQVEDRHRLTIIGLRDGRPAGICQCGVTFIGDSSDQIAKAHDDHSTQARHPSLFEAVK